jgi:hypothetical protein
MIIVAM